MGLLVTAAKYIHLANKFMKTIGTSLVLALVLGNLGCDRQVPDGSNASPESASRHTAGTNAGANSPLTDDVSGWKYEMMGGQDRVAAYQFNKSGSVAATVGTPGNLGYPALFWRIDEQSQIVIADDRDFHIVVESWKVLSIDESVVKVYNAIQQREETYRRERILSG